MKSLEEAKFRWPKSSDEKLIVDTDSLKYFLSGGHLQIDDYEGYACAIKNNKDITRLLCWDQPRRYFEKASNKKNCDLIEVSDQSNHWDFNCNDSKDSVIIQARLKPDINLGDLITINGWKSNKLFFQPQVSYSFPELDFTPSWVNESTKLPSNSLSKDQKNSEQFLICA